MRTRWLTSGAAAHLLTEETGRSYPYSPGVVRYYETTGRLPAVRTPSGLRLFRERDVLRLAAELMERRQECRAE
jgi:hypothetical protein